jgi:hypothetical protein
MGSHMEETLARFADALARRDADAAADLFAEDAVYEEPPRFRFEGREAIRAFFRDFAARHTNARFTVWRAVADPAQELLAAEWEWRYLTLPSWGFSGYACGNPLRWRLTGLPGPTVRIPGPRSRRFLKPYRWSIAHLFKAALSPRLKLGACAPRTSVSVRDDQERAFTGMSFIVFAEGKIASWRGLSIPLGI